MDSNRLDFVIHPVHPVTALRAEWRSKMIGLIKKKYTKRGQEITKRYQNMRHGLHHKCIPPKRKPLFPQFASLVENMTSSLGWTPMKRKKSKSSGALDKPWQSCHQPVTHLTTINFIVYSNDMICVVCIILYSIKHIYIVLVLVALCLPISFVVISSQSNQGNVNVSGTTNVRSVCSSRTSPNHGTRRLIRLCFWKWRKKFRPT